MWGIDLFSGPGGLTLGLKRAGFVTKYAIEFDRYAVKTYAQHSPNTKILNCDVREVNFADFQGKVDFVYGGPPCQPFSTGGLRNSINDPRNMIPAFIEAVGILKPAAFIMENVPGLVVGERRLYLEGVIAALEELGYHVTWQIVAAVDYGVPQKRRRLFIVGARDFTFKFPKPTHGPLAGKPYVTVNDVLPKTPVGTPNLSKVMYAKNPDLRPSPHDGHLFNGGGRPIDRNKPSHTILASAGGNKTHFFDENNLVPEYHAHLLAGGAPREGSLPGARRLSVKESAILQTFPADLEFQGPVSAQYTQIGDAVPPRLAEAMGRALAAQLKGHFENEEYLVPYNNTQQKLFTLK